MKLGWPFRRKQVLILPQAMSLADYRAKCIGEEVLILADHVLEQTKSLEFSFVQMSYVSEDGREFEVTVRAKAITKRMNSNEI